MNLGQDQIDAAMQHFKQKLNIGQGEIGENEYTPPSRKEKIKNEIKRLKVIAREFRNDAHGEWAEQMIELLKKEIA